MTEGVETGGVKRFIYDKDYQPKLNEKQKNEIEEAYQQAEKRKKRERRNRIILWFAVAIVILVVLGFILWKY